MRLSNKDTESFLLQIVCNYMLMNYLKDNNKDLLFFYIPRKNNTGIFYKQHITFTQPKLQKLQASLYDLSKSYVENIWQRFVAFHVSKNLRNPFKFHKNKTYRCAYNVHCFHDVCIWMRGQCWHSDKGIHIHKHKTDQL